MASSSSSAGQGSLNAKADILYSTCFDISSTTETFNQADLVAMNIASNLSELLQLCQQLMQANLFQILTLDGSPCYRCRKRDDATKMSEMGDKEFMVYSMIEASGTSGIWTKTLTMRTNLHASVLTRALKFLEGKAYVKQIKSVKFPKRKIYMLKELNPAEEVTGGPWFSDGEMDVEFIASIGELVEGFVKRESWREGPKSASTSSHNDISRDSRYYFTTLSNNGRPLVPYPPGYTKYPSTSDILTWIDSMGFIQDKDVTALDLTNLLDVLVYDGKLERMGKRAVPRASTMTRPITGSKRGASHLDDDDDDDGEADDNDNDEDETGPSHPKRRATTTTTGARAKAKGKGKANPTPYDTSTYTTTTTTPTTHEDHEETYRWIRRPDIPPTDATSTSHLIDDAREEEEDTPDRAHARAHQALTPGNGFSEAPCSRCPVFRLCEDGGPVDARSCGYFGRWLEV